MKKKIMTNIRLEEELFKQAHKIAEQTSRTFTQLITDLVIEKIKQRKQENKNV